MRSPLTEYENRSGELRVDTVGGARLYLETEVLAVELCPWPSIADIRRA